MIYFFSVWFLKTMQLSRSIELAIIYFEQLNRMIKQEREWLLSKLHPEHRIFFKIKKERSTEAEVGYAFRSSTTSAG